MTGNTLFRRLFIRFALGMGIAALVFTMLTHVFQARVVDKEWREELHQEAVWLAKHSNVQVSGMLANAWKSMHSSVRITFFDTEGQLCADSHPERASIALADLDTEHGPYRELVVSAELPTGGMLVMSRPYVPAFPSGMWLELCVAILLILGPMVLLLYPVVRSIRGSLREMGGMAREVSAGHFGMTLPVARTDELGALLQSLNDMSEKLAEAERLNTRLLHDVSHELRSPLGRIQVLADTIDQRPDGRQACVRGIEQEVALLDRLVGDLLHAARLGSEDSVARYETFSVQHWAGEVLARLEVDARSKGIAWNSRLPEVDREVRGDPQHLVQALANVVDNAIHALVDRPDACIEVTVSCDDEHWTLVVTDNGPGIPAEHLTHVFRRFYRVDEHRDRDVGGVGLGLSLARAIVEAHGGQAQLESQVGTGTTVTMSMAVDGGCAA